MQNIYILFFVLFFVMMVSYSVSKKKLLSPSFIAAFVFGVFSLLYILFKNMMSEDISADTMLCIEVFVLSVLAGELLTDYVFESAKTRIKITENKLRINDVKEIKVSAKKIYLISMILFLTGLVRLWSVYRYAAANGIYQGLFSTLGNIRNSDYINDTGPVVSSFSYIGTAVSFIYIFIFMFNYVRCHKKKWLLLLPSAAELFFLAADTSRGVLFQYAAVFIVSYFFSIETGRKVTKVKLNWKKMGFYSILLLAFFFLYGIVTRKGQTGSTGGIEYHIACYSCAAFHNLTDYIRHMNFITSQSRGSGFLRYIYNFFGYSDYYLYYDYYPWREGGTSSNIFTILRDIIHDFGFTGIPAAGITISFICTKLENVLLSVDIKKYRFYFLFVFVAWYLYCLAMSPIANQFPGIFLNPGYLLRMGYGMVIGYLFILDIEIVMDHEIYMPKKCLRIRV